MKTVETASGFTAEVNESAVDDMAFLDLLCEIDDGDPHALRRLVSCLLSEDDAKRLYAHVKTEDGRIPVSAVNAEVTDIIRAIGKK